MKKLLSVVCLGAMLVSGVVQAQARENAAAARQWNPLDFPGAGPIGPTLGADGLDPLAAAGVAATVLAPAAVAIALVASDDSDDGTSGT